jgi:hypothetical protein
MSARNSELTEASGAPSWDKKPSRERAWHKIRRASRMTGGIALLDQEKPETMNKVGRQEQFREAR